MRKLNLKKETLVELTTAELDIVVGGAAQEITKAPCISGIVSCATYRCPTLDCVATVANGC
ncbi:MAG TPA: class I lanthipeptide [Frankiaceae bacterium]|nr:class I lanthipeptide [Frankiaceae bacterium]